MTLINRRAIGCGILLASTAAAACSDHPTSPTQRLSPTAARFSSAGGNPPLTSNSIKYRQQTVPHQSNRSGSATLTSRALLGKDGNTVLEITTGQLDQAAAPGNIVKLQEKILDTDKELIYTKNFNGLRGPVQTLTFPALLRHSYIQTQGNVRDIDPKRTDVVTITERVNLRPDLAVTDLTAPERARPNTDVIIAATVAELNGDVGATDNCVLYVNGVERARIDGQWVADGDAVNCAFRTSFAAVGTYALEVRSENVVPGDWDTANNTASGSIEIVSPEVVLHGNAMAHESHWRHRYYHDWRWKTNDGVYQHQSTHENSWRGDWGSVYFWGFAYGQPAAGPFSSATFTVSSGGNTMWQTTYAIADANCFYGWQAYSWLYLCSYNGWSYATGGHWGGKSVYYDYSFHLGQGPGYYYHYQYENSWSWGEGYVAFADDVTIDLRAEGASGTALTAHATVPLGAWQEESWWWGYQQPLTCHEYSDSYYSSSYCYEWTNSYRHRNGQAAF